MPTTAKGANVFHASQAVAGADGDLDNQGSEGGSEDGDRPQTPNGDVPASGAVAYDGITPVCETEPDPGFTQDWSTTPPPTQSAPSARQPPPSRRSHKRDHSAMSSSAASPTSTNPSTSHKRLRTGVISNAEALAGLHSELTVFGGTFLEGASSMAPPPPMIAPSPSRKTKAIQRAQELEVDLDDKKLVSLIRIFQADVNAADAYMVLEREGVRKLWIESTLSALL